MHLQAAVFLLCSICFEPHLLTITVQINALQSTTCLRRCGQVVSVTKSLLPVFAVFEFCSNKSFLMAVSGVNLATLIFGGYYHK